MVIHGAVHIYMLRLVWYQQSFCSEEAEGQRELAQGHEAISVGARMRKWISLIPKPGFLSLYLSASDVIMKKQNEKW